MLTRRVRIASEQDPLGHCCLAARGGNGRGREGVAVVSTGVSGRGEPS